MTAIPVVTIPEKEKLNRAMQQMGGSREAASQARETFIPWQLRFSMLLDLLEMHRDGITEATLAKVKWHSDHEPSGTGNLHKYDDAQLEEAWAAVQIFCETGSWPQGDVALLGTETATSA